MEFIGRGGPIRGRQFGGDDDNEGPRVLRAGIRGGPHILGGRGRGERPMMEGRGGYQGPPRGGMDMRGGRDRFNDREDREPRRGSPFDD